MTPMVDVVMCILIFFMLGSSLTPELFLQSNTAIDKTGLGNEADGSEVAVGAGEYHDAAGWGGDAGGGGWGKPMKMNKVG